MNPMFRNIVIVFSVFVSMILLSQILTPPPQQNTHKQAMDQTTFYRYLESSPVMDYSDFLAQVDNGAVNDVTIGTSISPNQVPILARHQDGHFYSVIGVDDLTLTDKLSKKNIRFRALARDNSKSLSQWIFQGINWLVVFGVPLVFLIYLVRSMQGGGNRAMGFGKSKARMSMNTNKVTFEDVAGIDEAKVELEEVVDFLKNPKKFQKLGGKIPKGVLLVGPPGTGKTLLAKAISGEAGVPFFSTSGSEFVEMFVGVGASRVRDMFNDAKKNAPCIVFIDEIDAVGGKRGNGFSGGNDEREQTLNQLLVEMDGFEENQNIIIVAATNRPDTLDPALLRPGRFDRQVTIPNPDLLGREKILAVHMRKVPLSPNVDPKVIARGTPGFSGADLANLVNEAALTAARKNKLAVTMNDFDVAKDKILMGTERRSLAMTPDELKLTAYHEGGHAIISYFQEDSDPIHKATIIPRGRALGMVQHLPEGDRVSETRNKLLASIRVAMGGRIAEELIFGHGKVTTGAMSDIKAATYYATHMVMEAGLADEVGFRNYAPSPQSYGSQEPACSEDMAKKLDEKINQILDQCFKETKNMMEEKIDLLHKLAQNLIDRETLTGDEIKIVLEGGELPPLPEFKDDLPRTSVPEV